MADVDLSFTDQELTEVNEGIYSFEDHKNALDSAVPVLLQEPASAT